ncbi:MAG: addiction module protein [Chthoniobacteraceae bacterium]
MIASSEIECMSVEERLQAIEQLWDSVSRLGGAVASPDWHGEVLSVRRAKVEAGEGKFLSISELRDRLKSSS